MNRMAVQMEFDFGEDDPQAETPTLPECVGLDIIAQLISDPNVSVAKLSRLIAVEIAALIRRSKDRSSRWRRAPQRDLMSQITAFRDLHLSLVKNDSLAARDAIDMDSPKFKFVFKGIVGLFAQAMQDAGITDFNSRRIMAHFGALAKSNDQDLRRALAGFAFGAPLCP